MRKEELIAIINDTYEEWDSIIAEDLFQICAESSEQDRNEWLLRTLHSGGITAKEDIPMQKIIRDLSVWLTIRIFRNGHIENLHTGRHSFTNYTDIPSGTPIEEISQLTDANMMALNKEMVDHVGFLLTLFSRSEYSKISTFIHSATKGTGWDDPDVEKIEADHNEFLFVATGAREFLTE